MASKGGVARVFDETGGANTMDQMDGFSLCHLCASMTAVADNAKVLNSKEGFKHLSRHELAYSSRSCTFCFWLWSQLHRTWKPGSPGQLYLSATGKDSIGREYQPATNEMQIRFRNVSRRGVGWLDRTDQIEAKVKFPSGTSDRYRHLSSAMFEVSDIFGVRRGPRSEHLSMTDQNAILVTPSQILAGRIPLALVRSSPEVTLAALESQFSRAHILLEVMAEAQSSMSQIDAVSVPGNRLGGHPYRTEVLRLSNHHGTNALVEHHIQKTTGWLDECWRNHPVCGHPAVPSLPTRVIDVSLEDQSTLKLNFSQGQNGRYVTLSYCWGPVQEYLTTLKTIHSKGEGFLLSELPQTMQDAITVTRRLGVRYLWIDALCIIQDSLEDKSREINSMGEIYRNAIVTLAASSAVSVSDGFLRTVPSSRSFLVPGINGTKAVLRSLDKSDFSLEPPSLEERGWALQESLLSPRLLSFGEQELSWRCQTMAVETPRKGHRICKRLPSGVFGVAVKDDSMIETRQDLVWEAIVEDYSGRDLTFREDRLPAIAGIVSELASLWNDTYIAGLWTSCLVKHLAWERVGRYTDPDAQYLAPSWSWASTGSRVAFSQKIFNIEGEIVSSHAPALDERAPYGQVKECLLGLRAQCLKGVQARGPSSFWRQVFDYSSDLDVDLAEVVYALLGHNLEEGAAGIILRKREDGKYCRLGMWSGARADVKVWSRSCAIPLTLEIV